MSTQPIRFSLEVFPPKTSDSLERLVATVEAYRQFQPSYITVTFGAGASAQSIDDSRNVIRRIAECSALPVAAHLTCAGRAKTELDAILDQFWEDGVRHIVALRGDILGQTGAYQPHPEGYPFTQDFIAGIRARYPDMRISVAGYPETHPESPSVAFDLDHLKRKVAAGADTVLTQFFFDPEVFLRWRDAVAACGIKAEIVPGLLPILNFDKALRFAERCNARIPDFLHRMFDGIDPQGVDHKLLAMNVLSHQITRLIDHGVRDFHFYTLNDTLLTRHICTWLRAGF